MSVGEVRVSHAYDAPQDHIRPPIAGSMAD